MTDGQFVTGVKVKRTCRECGEIFQGGPNARYCRPCINERRNRKLRAAHDWYNQDRWLANARNKLRQFDAWPRARE